MVGPLWLMDIAIASVNAVLLLGILAIHLRSWRDLGGRILLAASAFVLFLMLANVASAYFYYNLAYNYGAAVAAPLLMIQVLQIVGYSLFFAVSWRY